VFPVAMPMAEITGSAAITFARKAPSQTAGDARVPNMRTPASAMPVGGHTTVTCGATNARLNPSRAAPK
jgi:hypothetical protein